MGLNNDSNQWHNQVQTAFPIPNKTKYEFKSIGIIHTAFEQATGTPIQPKSEQASLGSITLNPAYVAGLTDLEGFSHIILLYVFDRIRNPQLVVKPFLGDREHGIFATRAPARPNPIGISIVRLLSVTDNLISFSGADMLNNTPLLDIKPYVPSFDQHSIDRIGWLEERVNRLSDTCDDGRFLED